MTRSTDSSDWERASQNRDLLFPSAPADHLQPDGGALPQVAEVAAWPVVLGDPGDGGNPSRAVLANH